MKRLTATLLAGALLIAPAVASAQHGGHGGAGGSGHYGGGFSAGHSGGGSYHGGYGGGYGGYHGGYGGGYGGYRGGYGYRGYGYGYGFGAFGLGLALGSAYYDPWYWGGGYYPSYDYGPAAYASPWDDEYDDGYAPPQSGPRTYAPAQRQACGQWVWKADQNKYVWQGGACT